MLLAVCLAGCTTSDDSTVPDDRVGRFLVAPDKFTLYNCPELAVRAKANSAREKELHGLMAKAGPGADGRLVSTIAYRPEYLELRGEMNELRQHRRRQELQIRAGEWTSPGARASDNALR